MNEVREKRQTCFWIYILECSNGSYYTGYTNNLARRYRQHVDGTANVKYTRSYKPVRLAQCWRLYSSVGYALKVERLIKSLGRAAKGRLVREPDDLKTRVARRLELDLEIVTFEPRAVERAAHRLSPDDIRAGVDPFASTPRRDL